MGETLGIGLTHHPPLVHLDQNMPGPLKFILRSPGLPEQYRQPENWPAPHAQFARIVCQGSDSSFS